MRKARGALVSDALTFPGHSEAPGYASGHPLATPAGRRRMEQVGYDAAVFRILLSLLFACGGSPEPTPPPAVATPAIEPEPAPPPTPSRPNVLVVLWDTVRADRMSLYGHSRPTTPALDALAAEARVWEHAVSPGMWTVPVHASLFTGLHPATHGASAKWIWLNGHHDTLAERLGEAGYSTWAGSSNPYLSPSTNLLQGFGTVQLAWDGPLADATAAATRAKLIAEDRSVSVAPGWAASGRKGWPEHLTVHKDGSPVLVDSLLEWVDQTDGPWFAYVNLLEAHHPRLPSMASRNAVLTPAEVTAGLSTDGSLFRLMSAMEGVVEVSEGDREAIAGVYDATLRDLDTATAALVAGLRDRGLLDDTLLVITSDHGEHLGEHERWDHRWSVYEPLVHVPLLVRHPSIPAGRVADTTSTLDLFGTILDTAGAPLPPGTRRLTDPPAEHVHTSLAQPTPRLPSVREAWPDLLARWGERYHAVYEGNWKLLRVSNGHHELYNLETDPGELAPQTDDDAKIVGRRLNRVGKQWTTHLDKPNPGLRTPDDNPTNALAPTDPARQQLEILGYTEGE
ncbi:MAG: arylsulfatase A-like enzyme [Myxococcota bacterium]|jgi:arylsulfatase A-like enzyme